LAPLDYQKEYYEITKDQPVLRNHYGIRMDFDMETHVAGGWMPSSFIQSANAMEECKDEYIHQDTIVSVQIYSDRDFGISFPTGTDIVETFKIREHKSTYNPSSQLLDEKIVFTPIADYLNRTSNYLDDKWYFLPLVCMLVTPPDVGEYTLRVVVRLSDGRELEQSIKAILE
jgi:hypothetical protein